MTLKIAQAYSIFAYCVRQFVTKVSHVACKNKRIKEVCNTIRYFSKSHVVNLSSMELFRSWSKDFSVLQWWEAIVKEWYTTIMHFQFIYMWLCVIFDGIELMRWMNCSVEWIDRGWEYSSITCLISSSRLKEISCDDRIDRWGKCVQWSTETIFCFSQTFSKSSKLFEVNNWCSSKRETRRTVRLDNLLISNPCRIESDQWPISFDLE